MSAQRSPKMRPYWHVDAKWIAGLLLFFVLSAGLLVFNLVQITAEGPAVETVSTAMALAFSQKGLDDETEIAEFRQRLQAAPGGELQPIPGLHLTVREADIAGRSPREARLWLFRQLAEPLYRGGPAALAGLADDAEMRQAISAGVGALAFFSAETHKALKGVLTILAVLCLVLLIPLVGFSYRFGRIGSLGCVLALASLPGALVFGFLTWAARPIARPPLGEEAGLSGMAGYLASNLVPMVVASMARTYLITLAIGIGLMLVALLSSLMWRLTREA